jgi:hypothetical protein
MSYANGRKSGRLQSQSEQELIDLRDEIERLEKSTEDGNVVKEYDMELETGLTMLREFDSQDEPTQRKRATRRDAQKQQEEKGAESSIEKMPCSRMWPTGNIDGTGAVGQMVSQLLDLEKRVEKLAGWEKSDRKNWISSLETAVHAWNELSTVFLLGDATDGSSNLNSPIPEAKKNQAATPGSCNSSGASSTMSVYQVVCMVRVSFNFKNVDCDIWFLELKMQIMWILDSCYFFFCVYFCLCSNVCLNLKTEFLR